MTYTLIKTPEQFLVVSDEEYKEGKEYEILVYNKGLVFETNRLLPHFKQVVAQQDQIDFSALKEEEQKEIGWFDVEKLAKESIGNKYFQDEIPDAIADYKKGFQKSQELLSDRRFTLEELEWAFMRGALINQRSHNGEILSFTTERNKDIQSLSQKSWKVEVEVEKETLYTDDGLDYKGNLIPKLTNDKIKILKLVKNK
jgi:hypothetical protein